MPSLDWLPAAVRQRSAVRDLEAGEALFRQGCKASAIFEVEQGRLRLMRYTIDSHPIVLHTATKGELFAEAALFAGAYHCDALATIPSRVCIYPKRELLTAFRRIPISTESIGIAKRSCRASRSRRHRR